MVNEYLKLNLSKTALFDLKLAILYEVFDKKKILIIIKPRLEWFV